MQHNFWLTKLYCLANQDFLQYIQIHKPGEKDTDSFWESLVNLGLYNTGWPELNEWCFKAHQQLRSYWAHLHIKH